MRRVGLVGAGFISHVHAEALRAVPGVRLAAVIDPMPERARSLASQWNAPAVYTSVEDALAADAIDCAHVLVPPDRHADIAAALIAAGKPVLIEKPLTDSTAACTKLIAHADAAQVTIGVNQNFVHHPAFVRLRALVDKRAIGRPNHVSCIYNVPLRQIAARQFSHWMFASPGNLLLEQAVHPLSQIAVLAGPPEELRVLPGPPLTVAPGQVICPTLDAVLTGAHLPASLRFAVGQAFPFWQISIVCDDGVATADILANRVFVSERTRWLDTVDGVVSAGRTAAAMVGDSARNATAYGMSLLRLSSRSDPFFRSMCGSITAFHAALDAGTTPELDGRFGAMLVETCERLQTLAFVPTPAVPTVAPSVAEPIAPDVAILGGTGFIGTHVVSRCQKAGLRVSVMARSTRGLPDLFHAERVTLHRGDIQDAAAVATAIAGARVVVNLAHGGGGGSWDEIREAMVGGAETVARVCLEQGVHRLIHVGSIASLYLGPQAGAVKGDTPPDRQADVRADYARAKAMTDRILAEPARHTGSSRGDPAARRGGRRRRPAVSWRSGLLQQRPALYRMEQWPQSIAVRSGGGCCRGDLPGDCGGRYRRALLQSGRRRAAERARVYRRPGLRRGTPVAVSS